MSILEFKHGFAQLSHNYKGIDFEIIVKEIYPDEDQSFYKVTTRFRVNGQLWSLPSKASIELVEMDHEAFKDVCCAGAYESYKQR